MNIYTESRERLLSLDFIEGLAQRIVELDLSRVKSTDWLACKIYNFDGTIFDWSGRPLYLGLDVVDRAYGDDESCSWNSEVKRFASEPPKRRPRHSILLRLALWDAAFKIVGKPVLG
jgi:hypothetical protein